MAKKVSVTFLILLFFTLGPLQAASSVKIQKQLSKMIVKMATDYKQGKEIYLRKNVALSTFQDLSPIAKKHGLGSALQQLVSAEISRSTVFSLVERQDLDKILKEQQLQLSGLTDPAAAAKIGMLMNADLILSGSVTQIGEEVQLSLNLIDVETGSVIADAIAFQKSDVVESSQALLDMAYVQKMGVGIAINMLGYTSSGNYAILKAAPDFGSWNETGFGYPVGAEVRYRFTRNLMLGMGIDLVSAQVWAVPNQAWAVPIGAAGNKTNSAPFRIIADGISIPIMLYGNINLTRRLNLFAGIGGLFHILDFSGLFFPSNGNGFGINEFGPVLDNMEVMGARVTGGFEFFLTPRAAFSVRCGYDYRQTELNMGAMWHLPGIPSTIDVDMSGFSYQTSLAFYF